MFFLKSNIFKILKTKYLNPQNAPTIYLCTNGPQQRTFKNPYSKHHRDLIRTEMYVITNVPMLKICSEIFAVRFCCSWWNVVQPIISRLSLYRTKPGAAEGYMGRLAMPSYYSNTACIILTWLLNDYNSALCHYGFSAFTTIMSDGQ
jgi:hypothetical protein